MHIVKYWVCVSRRFRSETMSSNPHDAHLGFRNVQIANVARHYQSLEPIFRDKLKIYIYCDIIL